METEDDMIVVIVGDALENVTDKNENSDSVKVKEEPYDEDELVQMLEIAKNYGQPLECNELADFDKGANADFDKGANADFDKGANADFDKGANADLKVEIEVIKEELEDDYDYDNDNDYVPEPGSSDSSDIESESEPENPVTLKTRACVNDRYNDYKLADESRDDIDQMKFRRSEQIKSFVQDLRQEYPEFKENETELIQTLSEIMRNIKRPTPPQDYFVMNDTLFECRKCGTMSETLPGSELHYQEKHGTRYLVCFACGRDFRSTTNLYKHEKRCRAPDAMIVLKARALWLGRKGRNRPFIPNPKDIHYIKKKYHYSKGEASEARSRGGAGAPGGSGRRAAQEVVRYKCTLCTADFSSYPHLQSHLNLHKGLRPFRCSECDHAYTSKAKLVRHQKSHTGERFICESCGRPFKTKAALVVHMNTHAPMAKFACELCSKRYSTKYALQQHHRRVHLGLPPACACPVCPQSYARMSLVREHMQKEHGMSLLTRKMFLNALPTMSEEELQKAMELIPSNNGSYSALVRETAAAKAQ